MVRPIFVTGSPRSGTTLLTRLLDGHPSLLVFPIELKYFRYLDRPTAYPAAKLARLSEPPDLIRRIVGSDYMRPLLGESDTLDGRAEVVDAARRAIDAGVFREVVERGGGVDGHREAIRLFFEALHASIGRPDTELSSIRFVEKTPLQEENVDELRAWFPDAQFIHLVRNPYAVAVSERKRSRVKVPKVHTIRWYQSSLERAIENAKLGADVYRIVRFEDLVSEPVRTMQGVADFLGLDDHPILQSPTVLGASWGGNSSTGTTKFEGVSATAAGRWVDEVLPIEVIAVNRFVGPHLHTFGYDRVSPPVHRIAAEFRNPRAFLVNARRLMWHSNR